VAVGAKIQRMTVELNHIIVHARDAQASATFLADLFGLPAPRAYGPFFEVPMANGVTLDFMVNAEGVTPQHYAFLVGEDEFDQIYGRIVERGIEHYPEPDRSVVNEINHNDGGRGVYWCDPDDHFLEILTVPYGGWPE
jgi:catechol 2,3-dioxygenase-like lactoylglutathione lyase family enzyme